MFNRIAGVILVGLFAWSWFGDRLGADSLLRVGPPIVHEVAPRLHQGTLWARYLAPEGTCRADTRVDSSESEQRFAMRCLLDWARRERGLAALPQSAILNHSAALKAAAIVRCDDFSHTPCRSDFRATFLAAGWTGSAGENIAWGPSLAGSPRVLVDGWLHSDGHRENLFQPMWRTQGLSLLRSDGFLGKERAAVWVHQFGA